VNWFGGTVEKAFGESDTLVTEIADVGGLDVAQTLLGNAMLPAGQTLRGRLSKEDRAAYEAALERPRSPPRRSTASSRGTRRWCCRRCRCCAPATS
jgi:uncharacterized protein YbaP (TraB family)